MRYWPMSVIRTSPLLPGDCAAELGKLYSTLEMTPRAFSACGFVVERTKPMNQDGLVVMEGDETVMPKLVYMKRPTVEQWTRLERAAFIQGPVPRHFIFICDPLN